MNTPSLVLLLIGAMSTSCSPKSGVAPTPDAASTPPPGAVRITITDARAIALKAVAGKIHEEELEEEKGRWIYTFEIIPTTPTAKGGVMEVNIDAGDGSIIEIVEDDKDDKDDKDDDDKD